MSADVHVKVAKAFEELYKPLRYKIYYGGRGGRKSWEFARALLIRGVSRPTRIFCGRELQKSIKDSVHKLLCDQIKMLNLGHFYTVLNNAIVGKKGTPAEGTEFIFDGIKNAVTEIKSLEAVDICWVEEADVVSEGSWDSLIPTIRKDGSEIWVSFNPSAKHAPTYERFVLSPPPAERNGKPYALVKKVGWRDNPDFPSVLQDEMEILKAKDYEKYLHVWEGEVQEFADNAIYGRQMKLAKAEGRICSIPVEPQVEVETFWDLGKDDSTSIWFLQKVGFEHRWIDYFEWNNREIGDYIRVIKGSHPDLSEEENKRRASYNYGRHFMPHDVDIKLLGMVDNRKKQFELGGVKPVQVVPRIGSLETGIELTRKLLASSWFDERHCDKGIDALCNYKYQHKEDDGVNQLKPLHDWSSHGADAFRQCAQGYKDPTKTKQKPIKRNLSHRV